MKLLDLDVPHGVALYNWGKGAAWLGDPDIKVQFVHSIFEYDCAAIRRLYEVRLRDLNAIIAELERSLIEKETDLRENIKRPVVFHY